MKPFKSISNIFDTVIMLPIVVIILIILLPLLIYAIISAQVDRIKNKKELKELLIANNGQIYFFYSDYNDYDFSNFFNEEYSNIKCIKVNQKSQNSILINHLIKSRGTNVYPRLVKIAGNKLMIKEHYNSFKHLYKRNNDINAFIQLIEISIANLKNNNNESKNTRETLRNRE